jgi:hypothetical protein
MNLRMYLVKEKTDVGLFLLNTAHMLCVIGILCCSLSVVSAVADIHGLSRVKLGCLQLRS